MLDVLAFTSDQILRFTEPEELFTPEELGTQIRRLNRKWHPDKNSNEFAHDTFHAIQKLHKKAKEKLEKGHWGFKDSIIFSTSSTKYKFNYLRKQSIDTGTMYIGNSNVLFHTTPENEDLADNAYLMLRKILNGKGKMFEENKQFFPSKIDSYDTSEGNFLLLTRPRNYILLKDLLNAVAGKIDPTQVAWMISSMYNTATYLEQKGIVHNELSENTFFVNVENHQSILIGGWFYATLSDGKLVALPKYIANSYPSTWLKTKRSISKSASFFIKITGLKLLGDPTGTGMSLMTNPDIPKPMLAFLRQPPSPEVLTDYTLWYENYLFQSYGKPKFRKFTQPYKHIYKGV